MENFNQQFGNPLDVALDVLRIARHDYHHGGFRGPGRQCGSAAIAINRVFFAGNAKFVAVLNKHFAEKDAWIGHVAVQVKNNLGEVLFLDGDCALKTRSEIISEALSNIAHDGCEVRASYHGIEWSKEKEGDLSIVEVSELEIAEYLSDALVDDLVEKLGFAFEAKFNGYTNPLDPSAIKHNVEFLQLATLRGFKGFGGQCGAAAIAINQVLFDNKAKIVAAVNGPFAEQGVWIGHVAVFVEDDLLGGYFLDADAKLKQNDEIESWAMLDPDDSDYADRAAELGIEWNEDKAYEVSMLEVSADEVRQHLPVDAVDELVEILEGCKRLYSLDEKSAESKLLTHL